MKDEPKTGHHLCVCTALVAQTPIFEKQSLIPHFVERSRINLTGAAGFIRVFISFAFGAAPLLEHRGPWKHPITSD